MSKQVKHTPGPWQRSALAPLYIISGNEPAPICAIGEYKESGEIDGVFENAEANSRLISAAPELLEACKAAFHSLKSYQYGNAAPDVAIEAAQFVQAAIAKAEGKP